MSGYKTVKKEEQVELKIEKSRFIAHICPIETKEEGEAFFQKIKAEHSKATHNVPAMVIGEKMEMQWTSDDGEPQGTAGPPLLQLLVREEITNVILVVTRYFGGVKLGTGGLVRAYSSSGKKVIEKVGIRQIEEKRELTISIEYSFLKILENLKEIHPFCIEEINYSEEVTLKLLIVEEKAEALKRAITDVTAGRAKFISEVKKNA